MKARIFGVTIIASVALLSAFARSKQPHVVVDPNGYRAICYHADLNGWLHVQRRVCVEMVANYHVRPVVFWQNA